jgi:hypothetical protein
MTSDPIIDDQSDHVDGTVISVAKAWKQILLILLCHKSLLPVMR